MDRNGNKSSYAPYKNNQEEIHKNKVLEQVYDVYLLNWDALGLEEKTNLNVRQCFIFVIAEKNFV